LAWITIQVLRGQGQSLRHIAKALDRPPSTIAREVRRNNYGSRYLAHHAKEQALSRVKNIFRYPRIRDEHVRAYVVEKLKAGWSPEQVAGRIKIDCPGKKVSHEAIYIPVRVPAVFPGRGRFAPAAQAPAPEAATER
jgi:IS30 family transposase